MSKESSKQEAASTSGVLAHVGMKVPPPPFLSPVVCMLKPSAWPSWYRVTFGSFSVLMTALTRMNAGGIGWDVASLALKVRDRQGLQLPTGEFAGFCAR